MLREVVSRCDHSPGVSGRRGQGSLKGQSGGTALRYRQVKGSAKLRAQAAKSGLVGAKLIP